MPTYSNDSLQLGSLMPTFQLLSVCGESYDSAQLRGKPAVIVFLCGHCPYVQAVEERYLALARAYIPKGVRWVGISANDPSLYPNEDSPEALCRRYHEKSYPFPILFDGTQEVARAFQAVCTPEFFVYDAEGGYITMGGWMTTGKIPSRSPAKNLGKPWTPFYLGSEPLCPSTLLWGALSSGEPPRLDLYFLFTFAEWLANPTSVCTSASTAPAKKLINGVLGRLSLAVKTTNFKLET
jgi:Peroxiredoxin